jgi:hypothetical protein
MASSKKLKAGTPKNIKSKSYLIEYHTVAKKSIKDCGSQEVVGLKANICAMKSFLNPIYASCALASIR